MFEVLQEPHKNSNSTILVLYVIKSSSQHSIYVQFFTVVFLTLKTITTIIKVLKVKNTEAIEIIQYLYCDISSKTQKSSISTIYICSIFYHSTVAFIQQYYFHTVFIIIYKYKQFNRINRISVPSKKHLYNSSYNI